MEESKYTANLTQGLGLIDETLAILELWTPGMSSAQLNEVALKSGLFSSMTARRLRNIVTEVIKSRYLTDEARPARLIKMLVGKFDKRVVSQMMYYYTCLANRILLDFVREVYWPAYSAGRESVSSEMARRFVQEAVAEGKTTKPWSESVIRRNAAYLIGACSDFDLLEDLRSTEKRIKSITADSNVALIIAYRLHLSGLGNNAVVAHEDWALFGMDRNDVIETLKRNSIKGGLIVQVAGEVVSISWRYKSLEELVNGIA